MTVRALSATLAAVVCAMLSLPIAASDTALDGLLAAPAAAPGGPTARPRIATLPFSATGGLEVLGRELQRSLSASLRRQVDLEPIDASLAGESAESCVLHPACVDRVLAAAGAEALLIGQLEQDPDNSSREPRVLLAVVAPGWPVSYIERRATPEAASVESVARALLVTARGLPLPEPGAIPEEAAAKSAPVAKAAPVAHVDLEASVDAADAGLEESGDGSPAKSGKKKKGSKDRSAGKAVEAPAEIEDPASVSEARKAGKPRPVKVPKPAPPPPPPAPPLLWPARAPDGPWHGVTLELQGGAAYGALGVVGVSELATTDGEISDVYRWAMRQDQSGWSGTVGVGLMLGNHVEAGVEAGIMTAPQKLSLFYQKYTTSVNPSTGLLEKQPDGPPQTPELTQTGLHTLITPRVRFFPLTGSRFEPYVGVGLSIWLIPGFTAIDPAAAGPQPDLGPYQRFAIQPTLGMRLLVQKRLFVGIEVEGLIDPGEPFLTREFDQYTGDIPGQFVISPPEPARIVGSVRLGLGLLL